MIYVLKSSLSDVTAIESSGVFMLDFLVISKVPFDIKLDFLETLDYIILTSKSAIKVILDSKFASYFLRKKAIVVGESTATLWRESGGIVAFCPNIKGASGNDLAFSLLDSNICNINGKNILYIRALESASDIVSILSPHCNITDLIVYKSVENTHLIRKIIESKKVDFGNLDSKNTEHLQNLDSRESYEINNLDSKKLDILDSKDSKKLRNLDSIKNYEFNNLDSKKLQNLDSKSTLEIFKKDSIFIFGSPKIYKIFIKYFSWEDSFIAITLGKSTFDILPYNIKKLNAQGNFQSAINTAINLAKSFKMPQSYFSMPRK